MLHGMFKRSRNGCKPMPRLLCPYTLPGTGTTLYEVTGTGCQRYQAVQEYPRFEYCVTDATLCPDSAPLHLTTLYEVTGTRYGVTEVPGGTYNTRGSSTASHKTFKIPELERMIFAAGRHEFRLVFCANSSVEYFATYCITCKSIP